MSASMRANSWLSRNRIGSKLKIDGRLTHCSKHLPHLPILFSLARRNDRVLDLDDSVGPRVSLAATLREARAHHLDGVECSGDRGAHFRHALALSMWEVCA